MAKGSSTMGCCDRHTHGQEGLQAYLWSMLEILDVLSGERAEDQMRRALTGALMSWKREKQ
eukprot:6474002-Amphidinium_carterae.1